MKKLQACALILCLTLGATAAMAGSTIGLDIASNYMWRGWNLADEVSVQPNASMDFLGTGLSLELWGNYTSQNRDVYESLDEIDITLAYQKSLGQIWEPLSFSAGYTQYTFPNGPTGAEHTEEFFMGCSVALPFVSASAAAYHDINVIDGSYLYASISPPVSMLQLLPIPGLEFNLGMAISDYDNDQWGFNDLNSTLAWNLPIPGPLSVTPKAGYVYSADFMNHDAQGDPENHHWWGALSVSLGY